MMENFSAVPPGLPHEENSPAEESSFVVPAKFQKPKRSPYIWIRSIISLALYLVLGYFVFHSFLPLVIITGIVIIHEMGHFLAMKIFRYSDLGIFFIPLLGAYVSGTKHEVSQKQSAIILLAGPLPGIVIGLALFLVDKNSPGIYFFDQSLSSIATLFLLLNLINLFPVYPLDGGQLLNRVFIDEESTWSKVFVFLSAAFLCWVTWKMKFYPLLIFPALMLLRLKTDTQFSSIEKRIEADGINLDVSYDALPDADYWKIRQILIDEHPSFRDLQTLPVYAFSPREDKIMTTIQSLLHRQLTQDISWAGKLLIAIIWIAAFATPWLINMDLSLFFHRLGF